MIKLIESVPVLDLSHKYTHKIIGKRSFSDKVDIVKKLGSFCIKSYKEKDIYKVLVLVKKSKKDHIVEAQKELNLDSDDDMIKKLLFIILNRK